MEYNLSKKLQSLSIQQLKKCAKIIPGYIESIQGSTKENLINFFMTLFREEDIPILPDSITSQELRAYASDYKETSMMYLSHTTTIKNYLKKILKTGIMKPTKQHNKDNVWINKKANPDWIYFSPVFDEIDYANIYARFYGKKYDLKRLGVITKRYEPNDRVVLLFSTNLLKDFSNDWILSGFKNDGNISYMLQDFSDMVFTHKDILELDDYNKYDYVTKGQLLIPKDIDIRPYLRFIISWEDIKHPLYRKP